LKTSNQTTNVSTRYIFSADPEFFDAAYQELKQADANLRLEQELVAGVGLVSSQLDALSFVTIVDLVQPVFVRHIAPVQGQVELQNELLDIERLTTAIVKLPSLSLIKRKTQFAVQVRLLQPQPEAGEAVTGRYTYTPFAIKEQVVARVNVQTGGVENIKVPQVVVSVACAGGTAYFGISETSQNLSSWAGGERRFAREPAMVSRAEFKFLEALEVFDIKLPTTGTALDLGAAPGGWTRLLLASGLRVIAVDPAEMHVSLKANPRLEHYRGHAEPFLTEAFERHRLFDIVCNDMRMDARQAARLMLQAADLLPPGGIALTSLKLPHATSGMHPRRILNEALEILQVGYQEVRARQLFHNRQEVAVYLKK